MSRPKKFLKNFAAKVMEILPGHAKGKTIEIWFQDEARVGQKGTLTRIWAKKGTRPRMLRDQRHANAYIFGAVCPARDTGAALIMPHANTEAMNLHLIEIGRNVTPGAHAVVIIDGAGWHAARDLAVPNNLTLLLLPPYSPELNAQENVWQYLRHNYLAGRIFDTYDDIVEACSTAWNALIAETGRIASIATRDWISRKAS
jgi:transposase